MAAVVLKASDPLPELVADLVTTFRLDGGAVLHPSKEGWRVEAAAGAHPPTSPVDGTVTMPLPGEAMLVLRGSSLRAEDRQVFDAFATQLGVALESRRLQAEAAGAAALAKGNQLRTALLAAVSHDLRTPLASIKTAATSLLSEEVSFDATETRDLLETIDDEADRLNRLVSNLLDMSRLQTGALIVQARAVGLEEVVGSAIAELPAAPQIDIDVPDDLPPVDVDPVLLERALANIIGNALGFSPPGERVRIQAGAVDGRIDLRIIDRGRGIPVAERERAFMPFQRLGDNPNGAGVGLGLAVAKGFVEAMRGELSVDDTPGGGLHRHHQPARGARVTKLLVIDDEARFLRALAISLRARGYDVETATSGEEGLEVAAHAHPDLVVLDLGLPGLAGIDVLRALRGWTSVPVIVLSARQEEQAKVEALDLGADDYVTKPFGMDELLARLRATLRRSVPGQDEPVIETPDFTIDLGAKRARNAAGDDVRLTPIEWGIVTTLVRNRGKLVTQRHLLQEVWGPQYETETEYLRVHLAAIRRKLEPTPSRPRYFVTEAGMGYRFEWTDAIT